MSHRNMELVRRAFAYVSIPGDPEAMIAATGPGFEMHLIGVGGEPVYYAGAEGIREFFRDVGRDWESFRLEATDLRDLGDRVLVLADVRAVGRASGIEVEAQWAWLIELSDRGVRGLRGYQDQGEALRAVGLD
jgi:ketosteroid isomerase-like protein